MKDDKKPYLPNERGYLEEKRKKIMACSEKDCTLLPDPVQDPIVSNDISNVEFDYTSKDLYEDDPFE